MCTQTESISFEESVDSYPEEGLVLDEYFGNLRCFAAIFAKNWCYDFVSRSRLRALLLRQRKRSYTFFVGSVPCIQMAIYLLGIYLLCILGGIVSFSRWLDTSISSSRCSE